MARLPSGYQELKYIESTGTQWIDTGIPPFDGIIANFMAYIPHSIASRTLFGTGGDNGWGAYMGTNVLWDNYNDDSPISISTDYTGRITIVKNGRNSTFTTSGGTISYAHGNTYPQDSRTIFLFRKNGSSRSYGIFRLFLFSLSDQNGNFLWLGAPCRRISDGAIGMYDLVSQSFFGNSGTGEFIAGIPVIEPTWGSGVSQVSRKLLMRRDSLVADANAIYFGKSVQNGMPSIRNRVDIVDSVLKKVEDHLYPYVGTLPVPLRGVKLGASIPSAFEAVGGIYFDGTDYWCADTYEPSKGRHIQRIREVVMTGTAPYNVNHCYNQLTKTFLVYNYHSALTINANDLSAASYGPLCNYAAADTGTIFYGDYEHIGKFGNNGITFCVRYPFDYWGIASGEKTDAELIALVNALLKERYEAGVPYILRYVLKSPIVSIL